MEEKKGTGFCEKTRAVWNYKLIAVVAARGHHTLNPEKFLT